MPQRSFSNGNSPGSAYDLTISGAHLNQPPEIWNGGPPVSC